jgi:hypothetical protein
VKHLLTLNPVLDYGGCSKASANKFAQKLWNPVDIFFDGVARKKLLGVGNTFTWSAPLGAANAPGSYSHQLVEGSGSILHICKIKS